MDACKQLLMAALVPFLPRRPEKTFPATAVLVKWRVDKGAGSPAGGDGNGASPRAAQREADSTVRHDT